MASTAPRLSILIVGVSIAGPALASFLLLSDINAQITLLERAPDVRAEGQNIDLRGPGIECIRRLGLESKVRQHLTGEKGVEWIDEHDRAVASIAASKAGETQGPTADIEILRGTLAQLLVARLEELSKEHRGRGGDGVEFVYDDYIEELEQLGDSVRITLAKSKTQRVFDIVVGADGLQSRTRRQIFGADTEAQRLHKLDIYGAFFSIPRQGQDTDWRRWFHAPGKRGVMLRPSDRPDRITVFMHKTSQDPKFEKASRGFRDIEAQKALIRETFADVEWAPMARLRTELEQSRDFYYDMIAQVKMEKWSKGRVVLLGDAAHCASPLSGMGTSLALSGGYNLAGALAAHPHDISAAFQAYEDAQRPLVNPAQKLPPPVYLIFNLDTARQIWWTNYIVAWLAYSVPVFKLLFRFLAPGRGSPPLRDYGFRIPDNE